MERRDFVAASLAGLSSLALQRKTGNLFGISLAEWSFHRALRSGAMDHLDFARMARRDHELDAVEYVNTFFFDKARDGSYLREMRARAEGSGVLSLLIMCDGEGDLGDPLESARLTAVENHRKWVDAAASLGCHAIRVNARSEAGLDPAELEKLAAEGLRRLSELADPFGVDVLVENHGGLSSNGAWLASVIRRVSHPRAGTLPDFGNFLLRGEPEEWYDRYRGVSELMPFARAVSAKSHDFDAGGNETSTDYLRMMRIVLDSGYRGHVGIEYEGDRLSEGDGVSATRRLLVRVREELEPVYPQVAGSI